MDESAKTEMRNYTTGAGFLLIALAMLLPIFTAMTKSIGEWMDSALFIIGLVIILTGVILVICRNRDLSAITFIMIGMFELFMSHAGASNYPQLIISTFMLILAAVILTAKDKKKYLLAVMPFLWGICGPVVFIAPMGTANLIIFVITAIIALYLAFASASEKINLPFSKILKADVVTDFKTSGSVLGYILFGITAAGWSMFYFLGESVISVESILVLDAICGILMIFSGIILFAVAKMRFTPIMFILLGILVYLGAVVPVEVDAAIGIIMIAVGLFAILRTESRILPGIMVIIYGATFILSIFEYSGSVISGVVNIIPCIIAVYLAFAVFSQSKKLKLF